MMVYSYMKNQFLQAGMAKCTWGRRTPKKDQMYTRFKVSGVDVEDSHLAGYYAKQWVI
jgi:hypothetical protein